VSVNPVNYRVRRRQPPADGEAKVLGWVAMVESGRTRGKLVLEGRADA
jgi:hypothetical protein